MTDPIKRFVVSRAKWLRGDPDASKMLDHFGASCCLGHVCEQLGVPRRDLYCYGFPSELARGWHALTSGFLTERRERFEEDGCQQTDYVDSDLASQAIEINDNSEIDDAQREAELSALFALHGYTLEFTP
jgi:hypothetical protein